MRRAPRGKCSAPASKLQIHARAVLAESVARHHPVRAHGVDAVDAEARIGVAHAHGIAFVDAELVKPKCQKSWKLIKSPGREARFGAEISLKSSPSGPEMTVCAQAVAKPPRNWSTMFSVEEIIGNTERARGNDECRQHEFAREHGP